MKTSHINQFKGKNPFCNNLLLHALSEPILWGHLLTSDLVYYIYWSFWLWLWDIMDLMICYLVILHRHVLLTGFSWVWRNLDIEDVEASMEPLGIWIELGIGLLDLNVVDVTYVHMIRYYDDCLLLPTWFTDGCRMTIACWTDSHME